MPKFLESINLNNNKLENAHLDTSYLENLSSHPTTNLYAGRIYFNTTDDVAYVYDGSSWRGTAAPDVVNDILDGSSSDVTSIKYAPYSTDESASTSPRFYTSANNPTGTSRLNISSYFYATRLYDNGARVVNTDRTLTLTGETNITITNSGIAQDLSGNRNWTLGWTGQLSVSRGGTGQSTFTNGQLLIGNTTGNTLSKATLTAGTDIDITNGSGSITITHADTSTQASSTNTGRTYIQSVGLDGRGHVTNLSTATETVTDTTYISSDFDHNSLTNTHNLTTDLSPDWSNITSTPATLSGYGITDYYTDGDAVSAIETADNYVKNTSDSMSGTLTIATKVVVPQIWFNATENGPNISHNDSNDETRTGYYSDIDGIYFKSDNSDKAVLKARAVDTTGPLYTEDKVGMQSWSMEQDSTSGSLKFVYNG